MKTCTMPGCAMPHRARGLCSSHYNQQHQPNRHAKVTVACSTCGLPCLKEPTKRYAQRFCSLTCRDAEHKRKRSLPVLWVKPKRYIRQPINVQPTNTWTAGNCRVCGVAYVSRWWLDTTCSATCAEVKRAADKREHRQRRRARQRDAFVAPVFRVHIYERDNWTCQLCMTPVDRDAVVPHPKAPTIDHVLPLAKGGTHEPANVQLACFLCNALKRDTTAA